MNENDKSKLPRLTLATGSGKLSLLNGSAIQRRRRSGYPASQDPANPPWSSIWQIAQRNGLCYLKMMAESGQHAVTFSISERASKLKTLQKES